MTELANRPPTAAAPPAADPPARGGLGARIAPNVICFFSSMAVMVLELVAGREVSPNVGSSQYTWTSIIGVILAGMSLGNWLGGKLADKYPPTRILWILFLVAAGLIVLTLPINTIVLPKLTVPNLPKVLDNPGGNSPWQWGVSVLWMMALVFIWPATALGLISPVLAKMAIDANPSSGRAIGNVYTWGAVGMIIGTFLPAYWFLTFMGVTAIIYMVAAAMATLGLLTCLPGVRANWKPAAICFGALAAIVIGGVVHVRFIEPKPAAADSPAAAPAEDKK